MYVETADDLARKYGATFALLNNEVVYFREFIPGKDHSLVAEYDKIDGNRYEEEINQDNITPLTFDAMFINNTELGIKDRGKYGIAATLFKRLPRRQWRRGLGTENTQISTPITKLYNIFGKQLKPSEWNGVLSFDLIRRLQTPTYPTYDEAIQLCMNHMAVAFSPMFAVCLSVISKDKFLIASKHGFVGEGIKGHIWVRHLPSQQEITDYIVRSKQDIKMEVG